MKSKYLINIDIKKIRSLHYGRDNRLDDQDDNKYKINYIKYKSRISKKYPPLNMAENTWNKIY